jgi:hypothetical protein
MGRGDSRKTQKVRQRRAWRKKKARLAAKIAGGSKKPAAPKTSRPAGTTVTKKKSTKE